MRGIHRNRRKFKRFHAGFVEPRLPSASYQPPTSAFDALPLPSSQVPRSPADPPFPSELPTPRLS